MSSKPPMPQLVCEELMILMWNFVLTCTFSRAALSCSGYEREDSALAQRDHTAEMASESDSDEGLADICGLLDECEVNEESLRAKLELTSEEAETAEAGAPEAGPAPKAEQIAEKEGERETFDVSQWLQGRCVRVIHTIV